MSGAGSKRPRDEEGAAAGDTSPAAAEEEDYWDLSAFAFAARPAKAARRASSEGSGAADRGRRSSEGGRSGGEGGGATQEPEPFDVAPACSDHGLLRPPWSEVAPYLHGLLDDAAALQGRQKGVREVFRAKPHRAPLLRLHDEVLEFAAFQRPTLEEEASATAALARVEQVIASVLPSARLEVFGSRVTGLVTPGSDWDVCLYGVSSKDLAAIRALGRALAASKVVNWLEVRDRARVPIIALRERETGVDMDISFSASSGPCSTAAVLALLRRTPWAGPLIVVLKAFLRQRGLAETYTGGIGSFLLSCMVLWVAQRVEAHCASLAQSAAARGRALLVVGAPPPPPPVPPPPPSRRPPHPQRGHEDGDDASSSDMSLSSDAPARKGGRKADAKKRAGAPAAATAAGEEEEAAAPAPRAGVNLGFALYFFLDYFGRRYEHDVRNGRVPSLRTPTGFVDRFERPDVFRENFLLESPAEPNTNLGSNSYQYLTVLSAFRFAADALDFAIDSWHTRRDRLDSARGGGAAGVVALPVSLLSAVLAVDRTMRLRARSLLARCAPASASAPAPSPLSVSARTSSAAAKAAGGGRGRGDGEMQTGEEEDEDDQEGDTASSEPRALGVVAPPPSAHLAAPEEREQVLLDAAAAAHSHASQLGVSLRHASLVGQILTGVRTQATDLTAQGRWY